MSAPKQKRLLFCMAALFMTVCLTACSSDSLFEQAFAERTHTPTLQPAESEPSQPAEVAATPELTPVPTQTVWPAAQASLTPIAYPDSTAGAGYYDDVFFEDHTHAYTRVTPAPTPTPVSSVVDPMLADPTSSVQPTAMSELEALVLQGNQRYYTNEDLMNRTPYELSILRNGLFALSGKQFVSNQQVIQFFSTCSWYTPDTTDDSIVTSRFNDYQRANLQTIQNFEG